MVLRSARTQLRPRNTRHTDLHQRGAAFTQTIQNKSEAERLKSEKIWCLAAQTPWPFCVFSSFYSICLRHKLSYVCKNNIVYILVQVANPSHRTRVLEKLVQSREGGAGLSSLSPEPPAAASPLTPSTSPSAAAASRHNSPLSGAPSRAMKQTLLELMRMSRICRMILATCLGSFILVIFYFQSMFQPVPAQDLVDYRLYILPGEQSAAILWRKKITSHKVMRRNPFTADVCCRKGSRNALQELYSPTQVMNPNVFHLLRP
ncbi:carbohydrate sulfotransferase 11 isoform X1 [Arapaima gigas]